MPYSSLEARFQRIAKFALQKATNQGAEASEVFVSQEKGYSVSVNLGEIETLEHREEHSLIVTVYKGQRNGSASTTDLSEDAISKAIEKAYTFALNASKDPESGLADPKHLAEDYPDLSLFNHWKLSLSEAVEIAAHCESVGRAQDQRIVESEDVSVNTYDRFQTYANSHDFIGSYPSSYHSIGCGFIAKENNMMERDYEYTSARDPNDLENVDSIAQRAAERTVSRLSARKIKTQYCPVIFHAPVAKSLLSSFIQAISGNSVYRQASFLLNHLGQSVFPEFICLYQRPHLLKGMGSAPFDNEGVKTKDCNYVTNGILTSYVLDSYSARKLGLETTGNAGGTYNLFINHNELDLKSLFQTMNTGFFVTELIGQGINILTGDYSRGASGFWIENGIIQHAVHEVTIAGNLKNMFQNIVAISNDVDHRGYIHTGSIWINKMMVSGK